MKTVEIAKRTYGTAYIVTILPKLIRGFVLLAKKPSLAALVRIRTLFVKHLKAPLPWFLLILFGGYESLERLLNLICQKFGWNTNYVPTVASFTSATAAFTMIPSVQKTDVALTAFVRAVDVYIHSRPVSAPQWLKENASAIAFQLSTWQIMYSWFYYPESLPKMYNKWILRMANMDSVLLDQLRFIKHGTTNYSPDKPLRIEVQRYVKSLGFPQDQTMHAPIPCYYVHQGLETCTAHTRRIFLNGMKDALKVPYVDVDIRSPELDCTLISSEIIQKGEYVAKIAASNRI
jgi:hypothetical protein